MYLDALLQVPDVDPFCLKELCHDVPGDTQTSMLAGHVRRHRQR